MKLLKILIIANLLAVAGTTVVKAQVYTPTPLGAYPTNKLLQASDGNLYIQTDSAVVRISPSGGTPQLVASNCGNGGANLGGQWAGGSLVQLSDGTLYGTTEYGGAGNAGSAFSLSTGGTLTTIASFTGGNGSAANGGLHLASDGNFYGTTQTGGAHNLGTVFQMTPSGISMIALSPFWKWAVHGLTNLLLVVSGPSTFIYLLLWPFACFCREDLIRFVPGRCASTPKIVVIQTPIRQQDQRAVVRSRSSIS